jgi:hypothetical protein
MVIDIKPVAEFTILIDLEAAPFAELVPNEGSRKLRKIIASMKLETVWPRNSVSPNLDMSITKYDFRHENVRH